MNYDPNNDVLGAARHYLKFDYDPNDVVGFIADHYQEIFEIDTNLAWSLYMKYRRSNAPQYIYNDYHFFNFQFFKNKLPNDPENSNPLICYWPNVEDNVKYANAIGGGEHRINAVYDGETINLRLLPNQHPKYLSDSLLHEMIHMYIHVVKKKDFMLEAHGWLFIRLANEIARKIGWKEMYKPNCPEALTWPASSKP